MSVRAVPASGRTVAALGFGLLLLPTMFLLLVLLKYGLGIGLPFDAVDDFMMANSARSYLFNTVLPLFFVGSLLLAGLLNTLAILHISLSRQQEHFVGTVRLRLSPWNFTVLVVVGLALAIFTLYGIAENWRCWVGVQGTC